MALALAFALLCVPASVTDAQTRRDVLWRRFRSSPLLVVVGTDDPSLIERMRESVTQGLALRRAGSVDVVAVSAVDRDALTRGPVALVGTAASNRWIREAQESLPVRFGTHEFEVAGRRYRSPDDSLQLLCENPRSPSVPLLLVSGNSDEAVLDALGRRRRGDLQVRRRGRTLLLGRVRDGGFLDRESMEEFTWPEKPLLATPDFSYFASEDEAAAVGELARRNASTRARIEAWFGPIPESKRKRTSIYLYSSLERIGLATENTASAHRDTADGSLHVVVGLDRGPERLVAETFLDAVLPADGGRIRALLERGLATVSVSGERELDELDRIARNLLQTSDPPALEVTSAGGPAEDALAASFARFALADLGPRALPKTPDVAPLEARWRRSLEARTFSPQPFPQPPATFQRGFTYSQEGFDIHDGYLSASSDRSLDRLASLGVDAVAVVPYAFLGGPTQVELTTPEGSGAETDEAVVHVLRAAEARGMSVLLKPQIWVRRGWPGEIAPAGPEDEERFFRGYARWVRHYALLAEQYQVPLLSIGCELAQLSHGRRARWESLIGDVRTLYRGKLVYAANWGDEVERVDFWPLLDYIGVDFYYPLSQEDAPSDDALRRGLDAAIARLRVLSERERKPVLLTEIGYASSRAPWKSPHASDRERVLSLESQARMYDLAFDAIARETRWIRGTYWWKWPSDPARGGRDDNGFTPNGKPAEEVVRLWYRRRLQ